MLHCAVAGHVTFLLRLLVPAAILGAVLLIGERPANPPAEVPAASLSAAGDDATGIPVPLPGLLPGRTVVALLAARLPPAAAEGLKADAPSPEARSLSPPAAA